MSRNRVAAVLLASWIFGGVTLGYTGKTGNAAAQELPGPVEPTVAAASEEAQLQLKNFRIPAGWKSTLWAAEPMVANPVAFAVDDQGRIYLCESFRQEQGVTDNRSHDERWVDRDLASRTVADRIAYHEELLPNRGAEYRRQDDRIRRLTDSDRDGVADRAEIFANGFHALEDGTMAGILPVGEEIWVTNIPHLWRLRDVDGDGRAEQRESLQSGFGVRVAFRGHDMHGLVRGPDGRIYFSIGDRGYHLETADGRVLADPESGAVFRCEPDGSELEVVATGLRNPQELAFDELGNLFTGDNNSDSGDRARWVCVLPGGDSGWRMAYQYLPDRGPFNRERIWEPLNSEQPAYVLPPVANVADGPSGLLYYPGTGIGRDLERSFLLCDFRGTPGVSGIRRIRLESKGAFFQLTSADELVWQILATDCAVGPDGWLYASDWVNGWVGENKGRLYRFGDPEVIGTPDTQLVERLLNSGLREEPAKRLVELLGHRDQRLRMAAQFELVRRRAGNELRVAAESGSTLLARLHGLWGCGQLARETERMEVARFAEQLLGDLESEVRAQAAVLVGELQLQSAAERLAELVRERQAPRVQMFAALAFRRMQHPRPEELLAELAANADRDPGLRHGLVSALAGQELDRWCEPAELSKLDEAAARGLVVALRKQRSGLVARFLESPHVRVAEEAARAIYDLPLSDQLGDLAAGWNRFPKSEVYTRRALGAAYRTGGANQAEVVARAAVDPRLPERLRIEAVGLLASWEQPGPRDRLLGMWRPVQPRSVEPARKAFAAVAESLLSGSIGELRIAAVEAAGALRVEAATEQLLALAGNEVLPEALRSASVRALGSLAPPEIAERLAGWTTDAQPAVRTAATEVLAAMRPELALQALEAATRSTDLRERQAAWKQLGTLELQQVPGLLREGLQRLDAGEVAADTRLDLIAAARLRSSQSGELAQWLAAYDSGDASEPTAAWRDTQYGGNAERGKTIFKEWTNVSCLRCHRVGEDGGYVGPNLSDIGARKDRQYLLESIVDPNRAIAEKYETTVVLDLEGRTFSGIVNFEDGNTLRLLTPEGEMVTIDKQQIDERTTGKSAMPADLLKHLSPFDVRDLVEFLAQQRQTPGAPAVESLERTDR